jgi:ATP-binding cassette subfamily B protein
MDIIFKEYARVVWQKKAYFLLALVALAGTTGLDLYAPTLYKKIANGLASSYSDANLADLYDDLKHLLYVYAGIWTSWRFLELSIVPLDGGGVNLLEKRCFEILKRQKYTFYENRFSGSLIKQASRFSRSFEIIMDWFLFQFYMNILAVSISFSIFYQHQKKFALYFLAWVALIISWNIVYSLWKMKFDKAVAEGDSKVGGAYSDAISNMFIVKTFALENYEQSQVNRASDLVYRRKKIAWLMTFISFAVQGFLTFAIEGLLIYLMIDKWRDGQFEVGEFVLFQSIMIMLIHRLWEFGRNFRNFFTALADATEMADIIRHGEQERDEPNAQDIVIRHGEIRLHNVNFSYHPDNPSQIPLFQDFNLTVHAGEKIALVGHSGSGKSTLTKLLFRFVEPQQGNIYFDGNDGKAFRLTTLRKQISMVPQQPDLFHRSVRDNIVLGENVSDSALLNAAESSCSLNFIQRLPQGFDTLVGERGVKLSGGEKQRIAIARAFLEDAPIVVLDEATSALDSLTEKQIQAAIFNLIKTKTAIVIAHRLSTILSMDRIIVLNAGAIIEQGSHQELLAQRGKYYQMWQHQSGGFIVD